MQRQGKGSGTSLRWLGRSNGNRQLHVEETVDERRVEELVHGQSPAVAFVGPQVIGTLREVPKIQIEAMARQSAKRRTDYCQHMCSAFSHPFVIRTVLDVHMLSDIDPPLRTVIDARIMP